MNGFLCIDKPPSMTSRDVVNIVQGVVRPDKKVEQPIRVGHAGTLDPLATGLLVLAVGRATKLISYVQRMPKHYSAEFKLGIESDTEDVTGHVQTREVDTIPSETEVALACAEFVGEILQLPPKFSALRVDGRRAYDLARAGKEVVLQPRPINVHSILVTEYSYPVLKLDVECGSGTYIRSLGRDIGERLGCGAVMSALRRTQIGNFSLGQSTAPKTHTTKEHVKQHLLPLIMGVDLPQQRMTDEQITEISFGRPFECPVEYEEFAAINDAGELLAVMKPNKPTGYRTAVNFVPD